MIRERHFIFVRGLYNCMWTLIHSQAVEVSMDLVGSSVFSVLSGGGDSNMGKKQRSERDKGKDEWRQSMPQ